MNISQGELTGAAVGPVAPSRPTAGSTWMPATVLTADRPTGPDHLGRAAQAAFLAEVVAHRGAETPFCIGIFGPAGAGKSSFLETLLRSVERLGRAADAAGLATPFQGQIAAIRVEAEPGVAPSRSLLRQVAAALAAAHPRLAAEAAHAGLDPRSVAREAGERLNAARQRLDAERRALEALTGQQARLTDAVLFETSGSRIDSYARANRGRIERGFRGFGVPGDGLTSYKEAVREDAELAGPLAQGTGRLRAFWAYRGQGRLLVLALALLLAAWGLGALGASEAKLIGAVRGSGETMGATADWMQAQWHWLTPARRLLELGALAAVAANVVRGLRFLQPVRRGVTLLRGDLEARRRDLDSELAHQTQRVDTLARDAERAARAAAEAETRLANAGGATAAVGQWAGGAARAGDGDEARSFFATVGHAVGAAASDRLPSSASAAPARIVVGIDGLDELPGPEAAAWLQAARSLLNAPGFVTIVTADRTHLASGLAETDPALAATRLTRLVQIPYALGEESGWPGSAAFAHALLEAGASPLDAEDAEVAEAEAAVSALDRPWTVAETATVEALAPLAGPTPRAVKRFVNLYRIARADPGFRDRKPEDLAALAIGLALQTAGTPLDAEGNAAYGSDDEVLEARRAAGAALGAPLGIEKGEAGYRTARTYGAGR